MADPPQPDYHAKASKDGAESLGDIAAKDEPSATPATAVALAAPLQEGAADASAPDAEVMATGSAKGSDKGGDAVIAADGDGDEGDNTQEEDKEGEQLAVSCCTMPTPLVALSFSGLANGAPCDMS
jgi:hypothetical protein